MTTTPSSAALPAATNAAHPLAAVAPPTADRAPEQNAAGARRFAELLRARRSEAAATPATAARSEAAPIDVAPTPAAGEASDAPEPAGEPAASMRSRAPAAAKPVPIARHAGAKASVGNAAGHDDGKEAHADSSSPAAPAATGDRPPALALVAGQPASRDTDSATDVADDDGARIRAGNEVATDLAATSAGPGNEPTAPFGVRGKAAIETADERGAATAGGHLRASGAIGETTFASALGDVVRAAEPSLARPTRASDTAALPIAASGIAAGTAEARDVAAPSTPVALATPIDSPDFAAALGVQVSVLARDGVQHAELHLHPVETGPVSIRIEVEGTTARIDFGADLAATRHAIEQGLPELASALRDAGLTLAGGGVSQHAGSRPRGDDDDDGADAARPGSAAATNATAIAPPRSAQRRVAAGGIDLYA